ncbi:MAG: YlxM family DNA-binding protein [Lachnospiraceae bacterium]|jgi:predicted DNA-binding protein YlxM (UPF0122 family)|nr:YlxM family DNA-binding protein [Lachnospiraceae bacterium]
MKDVYKQTLLFDFYGELLTDHQKDVYSEYILDDLSISEISEELGISRQGVHDLIKRCTKILEEYEEKLGLISRFQNVKLKVSDIDKVIQNINKSNEIKKDKKIKSELDKIEGLTKDILEEL